MSSWGDVHRSVMLNIFVVIVVAGSVPLHWHVPRGLGKGRSRLISFNTRRRRCFTLLLLLPSGSLQRKNRVCHMAVATALMIGIALLVASAQAIFVCVTRGSLV